MSRAMSRNASREPRRGFTLIEVLAAFIIALLLIGPIGGIIAGVAGSMAGLERSAQRRAALQEAAVAAMEAPLRPGVRTVGEPGGAELAVEVAPYDFPAAADLERAGWRLYRVGVRRPGSGGALVETVRIGRP